MPERVTPLSLTIIKPKQNDTLYSPTIVVEGQTTIGAIIYIGATINPAKQVIVDENGHFLDSITVSDVEGVYSVFVKAKMVNHDPILESRTIYYKSSY
jgi:hypothetical protein